MMDTGKKRVASLWLSTLATDRLARRHRAQAPARDKSGRPLATVTARHGGLRIAAANSSAEAAGVVPGLPLADARALVPGLATFEADPVAERRTLEGLADWCGRYTPWTAVDETCGIWLDISGCAHLFGGEAGLLEDLTGRLAGLGFHCRGAIADTPGAAWAVARFAEGKRGGEGTIVPSGGTRRAIAPLPVAALRLSPATVEGLDMMGLRRIGELLKVPRAPLAARFGEAPARRLDQALGLGDEPISPRRPVLPLLVRLAFAEPVGRADDIAAGLERLIAGLCSRLERQRKGARRLELTLYRVDGGRASATVGTSRPVREADHLRRLFQEKLDGLDLGFGVETMTLAAATDPLETAQPSLYEGEGGGETDLARLIDRLGNRLGRERVLGLLPHASHIPERAYLEVPAMGAAKKVLFSSDGAAPSPWPAPLGGTERPVRLLPWPEPIEVMAPLPERPPVMFRWRRHHHRVARADGPERIGAEWWREEYENLHRDKGRDYYRVEDGDGRRFWIYREGAHRPGIEPRWYLHGLFA